MSDYDPDLFEKEINAAIALGVAALNKTIDAEILNVCRSQISSMRDSGKIVEEFRMIHVERPKSKT